MRESYQVVASSLRHEIERIKNSRFIADVSPVADVASAESAIDRIRREFSDANHHCWAYRLGAEGDTFRFNDDGEPGGSAGRPILQQIEGHDVTNVVVVITRYFGGTKLGVGGLVRAYGGATSAALNRADVRTIKITRNLGIEFPYEFSNGVQRYLELNQLEPVESDYGEKIRFELAVPVSNFDDVVARLTSITAGQAVFREPGT